MPDIFFHYSKFAWEKKGKYVVCSLLIPIIKTVNDYDCQRFWVSICIITNSSIVAWSCHILHSCTIQARGKEIAFITFEGKTFGNLYFKEKHKMSPDNAIKE